MNFAYWILGGLGFALEVLLCYRLFQDRLYRQFPYWFAYSLILVVTVVVELSFRLASNTQTSKAVINARAIEYYWINDALRQFALFLVVVTLLYGVLKSNPAQRWAIIAVIVVAGASVMLFWDEPLSSLCTTVIRNVSFAVVFLNLVLWSALIRSGKFDRLQMMITTGIGLQMTGESIGQALRSSPIRHSFHGVVAIGNVILVLSHLLCLTIWLFAIQAHKKAAGRPPKARKAIGVNAAAAKFDAALRELAADETASQTRPL